jgi:tetratricopeptide (TPR) repeat protein
VLAISLFTAIVAAFLANMAEGTDAVTPTTPRPFYVSVPICILQVSALAAVAIFLLEHGRNAEQAERYRLASLRATENRRSEYLDAALTLAPDRADLHLAKADSLILRFQRDGADHDLKAALRHLAEARGLSPLDLAALEKTTYLAFLRNDMEETDRALACLRRLAPNEPGPAFWAGRQASTRGDRPAMYAYWRQSLRASSRFLPQMIKAVPAQLSAEELLNDVIPANASMIVTACDQLRERDVPFDEHRFLRSAVKAMETEKLNADSSVFKARLHVRLNEPAAAVTAYGFALDLNPQPTLRLELCKYLEKSGMLKQATKEISLVLRQDPNNAEAKALQRDVYLKLEENP